MRPILIALLLSGCASDLAKRKKITEASYASGCLLASRHVCNKYVKEPTKFECYDEMTEACETSAAQFRAWLYQEGAMIDWKVEEAISMLRAWLRKEYLPHIHGRCDAFKLPPEIFEARDIIGRERFWGIWGEEVR
jgi:hypothetical protein